MEIVRMATFQIEYYEDRRALLSILASAGYIVSTVERRIDSWTSPKIDVVVYEVIAKPQEIKDVVK